MAKVVTFGEMMLRLTTTQHNKMAKSRLFDVQYGGTEANVAVGLSSLGHEAYYVSKLPNNDLGYSAKRQLKSNDVITRYIEIDEKASDERLGIYFLEEGYGSRPSKVTYDRKCSAFTKIDKLNFNWREILEGAQWFHLSGITLALGENVREVVFEALEVAKEKGIKVSFDFNYRTKLWKLEDAKEHYLKTLEYANVCFASPFDFEFLAGIDEYDQNDKMRSIFKKGLKEFNLDYIFHKEREVMSVNEHSLNSYCFSKDNQIEIPKVDFKIIDRIGAGDAYAAGAIHSLLLDYNDMKQAANYGLAACVIKHTIPGDACLVSPEEINTFVETSGLGNTQR